MVITQPRYYDEFRCIAARCPDSCCKAWAVQINDASAAYYRSLPGELGDALRQSLQEEDGDTILALTPDGRCPMWREDGLCRIQAALGEQALCQVCRDFPRLRHDYGDFIELGLELSCPEAARLILSATKHDPVTQTVPGGEAPEYDTQAMDILLRSRAKLLEFLDGGRFSVPETLAVLLIYGCRVQNELDGGEEALLEPEKALAQARSLAQSGSMEDILGFYQELEILTPRWEARLAAPLGSEWTEAHRAIARYGLERYYLQAVSDYDLISRIKLVILSCLLVKALGGDLLDTAQLYAKEIENDPCNIDAILGGAYTCPALADTKLLHILLNEEVLT